MASAKSNKERKKFLNNYYGKGSIVTKQFNYIHTDKYEEIVVAIPHTLTADIYE